MSSPASTIPTLDATVELAAGTYRLGEAGAERDAPLAGVRIGRWPVVNASLARFVEATGRRLTPGSGESSPTRCSPSTRPPT